VGSGLEYKDSVKKKKKNTGRSFDQDESITLVILPTNNVKESNNEPKLHPDEQTEKNPKNEKEDEEALRKLEAAYKSSEAEEIKDQ